MSILFVLITLVIIVSRNMIKLNESLSYIESETRPTSYKVSFNEQRQMMLSSSHTRR